MAQASEVPSAAEYTLPAAATSLDAKVSVQRHLTSHTPPRPFPTIAQCRRKPITATPATRSLENFLLHHATPTRTRVLRPFTSRHPPIPATRRKPNGPLTLATAPLFVHPSNYTYLNHNGISARTQGLCGNRRLGSRRQSPTNTRRSNK